MSVVYIAGPMTGRKHWNVDAFEAAEARLVAEGHTVFSPIHHDRRRGFDHRTETTYSPEQLRDAALHASQCIIHSDQVYLLEGWAESKGARAEAMLGLWLRKYVYDDAGDFKTQKEFMYEAALYNTWFLDWGYRCA